MLNQFFGTFSRSNVSSVNWCLFFHVYKLTISFFGVFSESRVSSVNWCLLFSDFYAYDHFFGIFSRSGVLGVNWCLFFFMFINLRPGSCYLLRIESLKCKSVLIFFQVFKLTISFSVGSSPDRES